MRYQKLKFHMRAAAVLFIFIYILTGISYAETEQNTKGAKYVFLFIGDGMGIHHRTAAEFYKAAIHEKETPVERLCMSKFPVLGLITTHSANSYITDSAAAATALATGCKTSNGTVGMDVGRKKKLSTIAEKLHEKGRRIGIITSVNIDHATPAGFYSHQPSRNNVYQIANDLINSPFEYFAGTGFNSPGGESGKEPDMYDLAKKNGFTHVKSRETFEGLKPGMGKIIVQSSLKDISLAEFTRKGIELLDGENGFFMMVEGGKIDWKSHSNDGASMIKELLLFDEAIAEAVRFYNLHPAETLIVVTSDHATGSCTFGPIGNAADRTMALLQRQKGPSSDFEQQLDKMKEMKKLDDVMPLIEDYFGLSSPSEEKRKVLEKAAQSGNKKAAVTLKLALKPHELADLEVAFQQTLGKRSGLKINRKRYSGYEPLTIEAMRILNRKAGIFWNTFKHTPDPVPVMALGAGQQHFSGYYDITDIPKKILSAMRVVIVNIK
jgi:alkaline phosphatase